MEEFKGFLLIAFVSMIIFRIIENSYTSFSPLFFLGEFCFGIALANGKKTEALLISLLTIFVNPIMAIPFILFYLITLSNWSFIPEESLKFISNNTLALFLFHESVMKITIGRWKLFSFETNTAVLILIAAIFACVYFYSKIQKIISVKKTNKEIKLRTIKNKAN
ncbi:MAG: hypothetical protein PF542_02815 [Nanoarchaeota archaeon]|jgi:hypothetical protein|nr:hypothetical protein [Nanoarchaeota archaeon]